MGRTEDPIRAAQQFVAEEFPAARWAILAGSVLTPARTAGSDLDLVVLLPDGASGVPRRESRDYDGWPVELLVYDAAGLDHYLAKELPGRRPLLHRMVSTGVVVAGDERQARAIRERCGTVLSDGPAPAGDVERDQLRYHLTDLLDDLVHATDQGERTVIAATAWTAVAEAVLVLRNHWIGSGKWLLRELRDLDPEYAQRWLDAHGEPDAIGTLLEDTLKAHGGPLFAGYRLGGEKPANP